MSVVITDVVLRDGLQDEDVFVATEDKVLIASALIAAGLTHIEATSFVSAARVPQLADADSLISQLPRTTPKVNFSALALNARGVHRAVASGIDIVEVAVSASPSHSRANAGTSPERALSDLTRAVATYPQHRFVGAVSTAFVCPFDGVIDHSRLVEVVHALAAMGVTRVSLADTLGTATTNHVLSSVAAVQNALPKIDVGLHLHNAFGQALSTALTAATELGIVHFDSAAGGYGGCPFAPGAHGNIATEELVAHFHSHGIDTGVDEEGLHAAVDIVERIVALSPKLAP